jgi:hypothetical protein
MMFADISKWVSGENHLFLSPAQRRRPPVLANGDPGEEMSTARPSNRKFEHLGLVAVVGAFASLALVCFVLAMQYPAYPSLTAQRTPRPSGGEAIVTSTPAAGGDSRSTPATPPSTETSPATLARPMLNQPPATLSDAQVAAFLRDLSLWHDRRAEAAPEPERKPPPSQRLSRRHWQRHSIRPQAERGLQADQPCQSAQPLRRAARKVGSQVQGSDPQLDAATSAGEAAGHDRGDKPDHNPKQSLGAGDRERKNAPEPSFPVTVKSRVHQKLCLAGRELA